MSEGDGEAGERPGGAVKLEPTQSGTDGGGTAIPKKDLKPQQIHQISEDNGKNWVHWEHL